MVLGEGVGGSHVLITPATHVPHVWTQVQGPAVVHVLQVSLGMAPGMDATPLVAGTVRVSLVCPVRMWVVVAFAVGPALRAMPVMAPDLDAAGLVSRS